MQRLDWSGRNGTTGVWGPGNNSALYRLMWDYGETDIRSLWENLRRLFYANRCADDQLCWSASVLLASVLIESANWEEVKNRCSSAWKLQISDDGYPMSRDPRIMFIIAHLIVLTRGKKYVAKPMLLWGMLALELKRTFSDHMLTDPFKLATLMDFVKIERSNPKNERSARLLPRLPSSEHWMTCVHDLFVSQNVNLHQKIGGLFLGRPVGVTDGGWSSNEWRKLGWR